jgi:hypothetical protein
MTDVKIVGNNGYKTGTTTAAYVTALTVKGYGGYVGKTIFKITNLTGATLTMYYKINGYVSSNPNCEATAITVETSINNATPVVDVATVLPYDHIDVLVKNNSGICNYQIDWINY